MAAKKNSTIIRKIEVIEGHGHHGGAWKVAYADFMTAMMAFFLLMWILSSSDEQKLRGIAEYFTNATLPGGSGVLDGASLGPPGTLNASNGAVVARGTELGQVDDPTPAQWEVKDVTPTSDPTEKVLGATVGIHENPAAGEAVETYQEAKPSDQTHSQAAAGKADTAVDSTNPNHAADQARFEKLQLELMQAMQDNPDLRPLKQNVVFEQTPEGLRIQIIDQEGKAMFASGRADMAEAAKLLLGELGDSLAQLPNRILISGHTDAVPFTNRKSYDNWDLSTDRANATRRFLEGAGVTRDRIIRVSGMADTELLVPNDPKDPSNRRISILLQYKTEGQAGDAKQAAAAKPAADKSHAAAATDHAAHAPEPDAQTETLTQLDETLFENLRSALR